jgi:hypothetical protein
MNNDKNSHPITPSGTTAHPEQTLPDNNQPKAAQSRKRLKKFEVELNFTQYSEATVIIEAASLAEAEKKADEIASEEIQDFDIVDAQLSVVSVKPAVEGISHE